MNTQDGCLAGTDLRVAWPILPLRVRPLPGRRIQSFGNVKSCGSVTNLICRFPRTVRVVVQNKRMILLSFPCAGAQKIAIIAALTLPPNGNEWKLAG